MSLPPVLLLDIDGVINAIAKKPDPNVWPRDQWITGTATADSTDWPILAAKPVLDFIRDLHKNNRAEIRWHTTWQHDATNIAALLDLPDFPVQACPEFAIARQRLAGLRATRVNSTWWKLPAAERVVGEEGRALVWVDDDASFELRPHQGGAGLSKFAPTLIVSPPTHTGLTRRNLRQITTFLNKQATA